jgi:DNA-binding transcriptional regulator WhiA
MEIKHKYKDRNSCRISIRNDNFITMYKWCINNFGHEAKTIKEFGTTSKWIVYTSDSLAIFDFLHETDATLFKLTWL